MYYGRGKGKLGNNVRRYILYGCLFGLESCYFRGIAAHGFKFKFCMIVTTQ